MVRKQDTQQLKEYWGEWLTQKSTTAGDYLIEAYMPLVEYHVQRIRTHLPKSVREDDLRSHGMTGLLDALEKFDAGRDLKFDTYASFRVRGAIMDGLRQEDWLPRSVRDRSKKIEQTIESLEQKYGRNVLPEEVAAQLNIPVEEVLRTMNDTFFSHLLSIDEPTNDSGKEDTYANVIVDKNSQSPEDHVMNMATREELAAAVGQLNKNEQLVVSLFYVEEMTLTEIGEIMNLSTSRISQIHSKCIFKLQNLLKQN
ncbi:FliA/WhiG family RNA polymerase sigma factor [Alkalicoccus daliensis]|uniref:RNA polymerase, sigma 28 subunit, SigD/FliA/WhiG n=1 Tax=Alkalicoccus daliensis TaxID=745820 RepID=A0A1H0A628_9BACI|nr:FliA/WhiG family RNA polymerase sigma factor [Alkalicoccus daliensis]SDN28867.1 RNA polymerase, sigma 28 subunit, SigD/FliA/WhiG [Alkalicoccus daliensis]